MIGEINYDYISQYIRAIRPPSQGILKEIELKITRGEETWPIIKPEVASLIEVILSIKKPMKVLEIGTAVAYSSILMSQHLPAGGKITTIERFDVMQNQARSNIKRSNLENMIHMIQGDAAVILTTLPDDEFDFIFMDSAKSQYITLLPECVRLLKKDGILMTDNVLHNGDIAKSRYLIPRRQRTTYGKLNEFLHELYHHSQLKSAVLPFGDGIAISHKVGGKNNE